jgi:hypothetical protein
VDNVIAQGRKNGMSKEALKHFEQAPWLLAQKMNNEAAVDQKADLKRLHASKQYPAGCQELMSGQK